MSGRPLFAISVAAVALSGLLFGFDTAVVAGVTGDLVRVFGLSPGALGLTVSSALVGTLVGALGVGAPGDRYGSRNLLAVMAVFYLVSALGCASSAGLPAFIAFRVLGGIAIGGSSVLAPVYIAEIAPAERRGRLVGCFQLSIVAGILLAYLSNAVIGLGAPTGEAWRWKLGVAAAPAAVLLGLFLLIPQSPRWLRARGRDAEAERAAARLGAPLPAAATHAEGRVALSWARHRRPILLVVALAAFNQLSGINAILYYLNDIFAAAGYGALSAAWQAVVIGAVNLAFTLLGMALIDRVGRRALLMGGGVGLAACLALTALIMSGHAPRTWLLPALIGFIASFAASQGAVVWVYMSEIFPQEVRAQGAALGSATHWAMNALIAGVFPVIAAASAAGPFVVFALMMVAMLAFLTRLPETRGLGLEEVAGLHRRDGWEGAAPAS